MSAEELLNRLHNLDLDLNDYNGESGFIEDVNEATLEELIRGLENCAEVPVTRPGVKIGCHLCDTLVKGAANFTTHLTNLHGYTLPAELKKNTKKKNKERSFAKNPNRPQTGDHCICMWSRSMWQYFPATILSFSQETLMYYIAWDDQDTSGRDVSYENIAVNKTPTVGEVGVGSTVLFHQARYGAVEGERLAGVRWHQGIITSIVEDGEGNKIYAGHHSKGADDGKWITFKDYNFFFSGLKIEDLRCAPNVFDLMDDNEEDDDEEVEDVDVYVSFEIQDSWTLVSQGLAPRSYTDEQYSTMVDPLDVIARIEERGLKVAHGYEDDLQLKCKVMNSAEAFISCISDLYAANKTHSQELQYAKKTKKIPCLPLVVGAGGWEWMNSVVGMVIAGELFIHFGNKDVMDVKMDEVHRALEKHCNPGAIGSGAASVIPAVVAGPPVDPEVFISYCWVNSNLAHEAGHVRYLDGSQWADPRLCRSYCPSNMECWLDIEQLGSAQDDSMFGQIAAGLKKCKVILAFISTSYARSDNCKMEFQYAVKSLRKPVIPIIVGDGDEWRETVIGCLVAGLEEEPLMMQDISEAEFKQLVDLAYTRAAIIGGISEEVEASEEIEETEGASEEVEETRERGLVVGDHVVSHHHKCAYYMATIASFDRDTLMYTVNWDDGDPSGRETEYNQVGKDVVPDPDDIGVGQEIFFPQGGYGGSEGNNSGGERWHCGIVTSIETLDGVPYYSGNHSKGAEDGKWVTYRGYEYNFNNVALDRIRVAPNVMDALAAM